MRLRTLTLCTALVAATLGTPTLHAAPFTPEQEARIKELIRETLIANPRDPRRGSRILGETERRDTAGPDE